MHWSETKFLVRGFEFAQGTLLPKESLSIKCCHVGNISNFSFMLEALHWRSLDRIVNYVR